MTPTRRGGSERQKSPCNSSHLSLNEALDVVDRLKPERAYFTHMSHDLEHEATNRSLPPGVELAYDGLKFEF